MAIYANFPRPEAPGGRSRGVWDDHVARYGSFICIPGRKQFLILPLLWIGAEFDQAEVTIALPEQQQVVVELDSVQTVALRQSQRLAQRHQVAALG